MAAAKHKANAIIFYTTLDVEMEIKLKRSENTLDKSAQ